MVDSRCPKFGDCIFSCFGFIMRTNKQTESHTDPAKHFTPATVIAVSKYNVKNIRNCSESETTMGFLQEVAVNCILR